MAKKTPNSSQPMATRRSTRQSLINKNGDEDYSPEAPRKRPSARDHLSNGVSISNCIQNGQKEEVNFMPRKTTRRKSAKVNVERLKCLAPGQSSPEYALQQVTPEELHKWEGWCEVESEPAFFNAMLRDAGVSDVKIHEVFSLDEDMLMFLPKPIFGLIFLFQVTEDENNSVEEDNTYPDNVWFANQITSNSCATVALLNMIMNIDAVRLGDELEGIKKSTENMTPPQRGSIIDDSVFLRSIHNSFARKMDILNADLFLATEAEAAEAAAKGKGKKGKKKVKESDEEIPGFHFIAFIPIDGHLWGLDGLQRQPNDLGEVGQDWMELARPMLANRMEQYEDNSISFSLQAVCKSPLLSLPGELATNMASIQAIELRLNALIPEWRLFSFDEQDPAFESALQGVDSSCNPTAEMLENALPQGAVHLQLEDPSMTIESLMAVRKDLIYAQSALRSSYMEEVASIEDDARCAEGRRFDYTPFIATWSKMLAEKDVLQDLLKAAN